MKEQETNKAKIDRLAREIRGIRVAMMTSISRDGTLHSRPMVPQEKDFDGELWFFTGQDTVKVDEIQANDRVNVAFVSPTDNRYVSVSGRAEIRRDPKKIQELWSPALKAWFPKGKDDPNIVLLHVQPEVAQYWDAASSSLVQIAGFVKALVTGERAEGGRNETVRF
jgi:general stress protein 26